MMAGRVPLALALSACTAPPAPTPHIGSAALSSASASVPSAVRTGNLPAPPASSPTPHDVKSTVVGSDVLEAHAAELKEAAAAFVDNKPWQVLDARSIVFPGGHRVIIVALQTPSLICGIGLLDPKRGRGVPIPMPTYTCKTLEFVADDDLNADRVPDLWFIMTAPSNRYEAEVEESFVYLSLVAEQSYCYSRRLSHLAGSATQQPQSLRQLTRSLFGKVGAEAFACTPSVP